MREATTRKQWWLLQRLDWLTWSALVLGIAGSSCAERREVGHPTRENLPADRNVLAESVPVMTASALGEWQVARAAFESAQSVATIGDLDAKSPGDEPYVFGRIADVEMDDAGHLYVLDRQYRQVRIFSFEGAFIDSFGSAGSGPNEFLDPSGIALLDAGRLAVSDRGARLKVFAPTEDGYRHENTVQLSLVPEGLCSDSSRVFIAGWSQATNTIVHEVTARPYHDDISFGTGYRSPSWLVQDQLSDGRVACVGDPLHVLFAFEHLPVLRAYRADGGALAWATRIGGYAQNRIMERISPRGSSSVFFPSAGMRDVLVSLRRVSPQHVLLQYLRGEPDSVRDGSSMPTVRTYLIEAATGHGALISDTLPLIIAGDLERQVALWMFPYPKLETRTHNPRRRESI